MKITTIQGEAGKIEIKFHKNKEDETAPVALILHPHPLGGGTMNNKVVYHAYHSLVKKGFSVMRFNFRGVGRSDGNYDGGIGELNDAIVAFDYLQNKNTNAQSYWIFGFSFGAWIALQLLMRRPELNRFIAVAPPVNKYDFSFLNPCPASGLVIQGGKDEIVPENEVNKFVKKLSKPNMYQIDYEIISEADHFFNDYLDQYKNIIEEYVDDAINNYQENEQDFPEEAEDSRSLPGLE